MTSSTSPAGRLAPCWFELVQASALSFHLLSAKVVLHRFAAKVKKQLEGKNSLVSKQSSAATDLSPRRGGGGGQGKRSRLGAPTAGFRHPAEDKMLLFRGLDANLARAAPRAAAAAGEAVWSGRRAPAR